MKDSTAEIFNGLFARYPALEVCREDVNTAFELMFGTYRGGGTVFTCGNGGSAADADHIVGELLKKFRRDRDIPADLKLHLIEGDEDGALLAERLEGSLPAVSLCAQTAILTAFANDVEWDLAFAQQLLGLAKEGDTLVALSTSGNSRNCVLAATLAHELGVNVVSLTGESGGKLAASADAPIRVPANETYLVQEYHLPVYHALCAMLEEELF